MEISDKKLLVKINTKLNGLCDQFIEVRDDNKTDHQKIWEFLERNLERKINSKIFYWVLGFVILFIISLSTMTTNNYAGIKVIENHIEITQKQNNE